MEELYNSFFKVLGVFLSCIVLSLLLFLGVFWLFVAPLYILREFFYVQNELYYVPTILVWMFVTFWFAHASLSMMGVKDEKSEVEDEETHL